MKKLIIGLILFAVPFSAFASFDSNLSYGSKGEDVTALQEFLTDQGVYTGPVTGNFYSLTLAAVKIFQTKQSITPVSGFVGPITRGVINQIILVQAPDTEGDAATTTPPVDLSLLPKPVQPPQIVYVPVYTPPYTPPSIQSQSPMITLPPNPGMPTSPVIPVEPIIETFPEVNSVVNSNIVFPLVTAANAGQGGTSLDVVQDSANNIGTFVLQAGNKQGIRTERIWFSTDAPSITTAFKVGTPNIISSINYMTGLFKPNTLLYASSLQTNDVSASTSAKIYIAVGNKSNVTPGTYSIKVEKIDAISLVTGNPIEIAGFPLTFTFQVQ